MTALIENDDQLKEMYNNAGIEGYTKLTIWTWYNECDEEYRKNRIRFSEMSTDVKIKLIDLVYSLAYKLGADKIDFIVNELVQLTVKNNIPYSGLLDIDNKELLNKLKGSV